MNPKDMVQHNLEAVLEQIRQGPPGGPIRTWLFETDPISEADG